MKVNKSGLLMNNTKSNTDIQIGILTIILYLVGIVSFKQNHKRKLTPRECFRLQDFPDTFKMPCSDTQMYKQAGNSITVGVLAKIVEKLNIKKNT